MRAIRRFGSYEEAAALESLPPLTRETVKRLGYRSLCLSENQIADRANFRDLYELLEKREAENSKIPLPVCEKLSALMAGCTKQFELEAGKERVNG